MAFNSGIPPSVIAKTLSAEDAYSMIAWNIIKNGEGNESNDDPQDADHVMDYIDSIGERRQQDEAA